VELRMSELNCIVYNDSSPIGSCLPDIVTVTVLVGWNFCVIVKGWPLPGGVCAALAENTSSPFILTCIDLAPGRMEELSRPLNVRVFHGEPAGAINVFQTMDSVEVAEIMLDPYMPWPFSMPGPYAVQDPLHIV
jgi:hypothetical protein